MRASGLKRMGSRFVAVAMALVLVVGLAPAVGSPAAAYAAVAASNPRIVADSSMDSGQVVTWDCVWLGTYPQTEIASGDAAYASAAAASYDANGDARVGGTKYRRISRDDATYGGYWPDSSTTYRYFRYDPVKWRVLSVSGDRALVVADQAIDGRRYNENYTNVTWETSSLRSWLNGYGSSANQPGVGYEDNNFLSTAFGQGEQAAISTTPVANADSVTYGTSGGTDTQDKVFLLSESEVYGDAATAYGFARNYNAYDEARRCKVTAFANAMGAYRYREDSYDGNGWWWLRSPGSNAYYAAVDSDGWVYRYGSTVDRSNGAVRPALTLNLKSSDVAPAGTVSSNGAVDEQAATGTGGSTGGDSTGDGGGSGSGSGVKTTRIAGMAVGGNASANVSNGAVTKFFPGDYKLKQTIVPVEFAEEHNDDGSVTYKLGIGIGRKNLLDKKSTWNQLKANVEAVDKGTMRYEILAQFAQGKTAAAFSTEGFKAKPKVGITGYGEFKFKDGVLVSKASKVVAEAKWEAKADWQFWTPIGPVYIQLKGGAGVKAQGKAEYAEAGKKTTFSGSLTLEPNIALEGGYGIASVASIGVQGSAKLPIQVAPPTKGTLEAKASLHLYLVFVIDYSYDLAKTTVPLWDTTGTRTSGASGGYSAQAVGGAGGAGGLAAGAPAGGFFGADGSHEGEFAEVDRSYADATTAWSGVIAGTSGGLSTQDASGADVFITLQESVMPNTVPLLAEVGGKQVMVFQQNDLESDTLNSSRLVYSVLDGGAWSEPACVWDTGTLDAYADLRVIGDDLYVAWQKERSRIEGDVAGDAQAVLSQMAAASEICVARFDAASGTFADAHYVTDNQVLDMMPSLVADAESLQVAYVRNEGNELDQSKGSSKLVVSGADVAAGGAGESVLAEASGYVSGISAFSASGQAEVAYATIAGDEEDMNAGEAAGAVHLARSGATLSGAGESPTGLQWLDGALYWTSDGLVRAYDGASGEVSTLNEAILAEPSVGEGADDVGAGDDAGDANADDAGDADSNADDPAEANADDDAAEAGDDVSRGAAVGENMKVVSVGDKKSIVWTESDAEGATSRICSAVLLPDGTLSDAVELHALDRGISASDVVLADDGAYCMALNEHDAAGAHSLAYATLGAVGSLAEASASTYIADDGSASITYGFTNNSEEPVESYVVTVRSNGQVVKQQVVEKSVAPGATDAGEFSLDLGGDAGALAVEVAPAADDARQGSSCESAVMTEAQLDDLVTAPDDSAPDGGGADDGPAGGDGANNDPSSTEIKNVDSGAGGNDGGAERQPASTTGAGSNQRSASETGGGSGQQAASAVVSAGSSYTVSGMAYKVTSPAAGSTGGAVTLVRAANAKKITVPASVKLPDGSRYRVTSVAKGAFKNLSKVTSITLGANVTTVSSGAFQNLGKLKSVVFGKSVAKVGKGAFKKTPKLARITVKGTGLKKKSSVKGMLKGSKLRKPLVVKVPKPAKKACKKSFAKANLSSPKKITVK